MLITSKIQRKAERPSRDELKVLIRTLPFTKIGQKFNVSDKVAVVLFKLEISSNPIVLFILFNCSIILILTFLYELKQN